MRIDIIAGARPNFMKIAPILRALRERSNLQEATELYPEEFEVTSYGRPSLTTFEVSARAA